MHVYIIYKKMYLLHFRENGRSGNVFALVFTANEKQIFDISPIVLGQGLVILMLVLEGEWSNIRILSTPEPCLLGPTNWEPYVPSPFPDEVK